MSPASLEPLLYLVITVQMADWREISTWTYVVAKKAAIFLKISVSLFVVSSNPGVSMSVTCLPSRVNLSAS